MKGMKRRVGKTVSYAVFYEQAPEGGYVATVPALPGCHTQGETLEETERNVKEAVEVYLESLAAHGEPIPEEGPSLQGRVTVPAWFMTKLPSLTARQVVRALKHAGFVEDRQKGSHLVLRHPERKARAVVPMHAGQSIKASLLRAIIRDADLSVDEFVELL
jgi:predicted RNA binding protein YcfA (HicA-like mRNA interferase family)/predicted RNase H-like HicB family nuclease